MDTKRFFDEPTQVAFYDVEDKGYIGGIAYCDEIICLECGGTLTIDEFLAEIQDVAPHVKHPLIPLDWCNISAECLGDLRFDTKIGIVS